MSNQSKETLLQVSLTEEGEVEVFCPDRVVSKAIYNVLSTDKSQ